jgi:hypothetical protein
VQWRGVMTEAFCKVGYTGKWTSEMVSEAETEVETELGVP